MFTDAPGRSDVKAIPVLGTSPRTTVVAVRRGERGARPPGGCSPASPVSELGAGQGADMPRKCTYSSGEVEAVSDVPSPGLRWGPGGRRRWGHPRMLRGGSGRTEGGQHPLRAQTEAKGPWGSAQGCFRAPLHSAGGEGALTRRGQDRQPRPGLRASRDSAMATGWLCSWVGAATGTPGLVSGGGGVRMSGALFVVSSLRAGTFSAL